LRAIEHPEVQSGHAVSSDVRLDQVGICASLLCAIHCAVMPFIITVAPFLGLGLLTRQATEWTLLTASAAFACSSLCLGYGRHRSRRALAVMAIGLGLLAVSRIAWHMRWGAWGLAATVAGGLVIAGSHWLNSHLCRACGRCQNHVCRACGRCQNHAANDCDRNVASLGTTDAAPDSRRYLGNLKRMGDGMR
jgi:hypothetical protein